MPDGFFRSMSIDRDSPRRIAGRRDCGSGGVLFVRNQQPDTNGHGAFARRCRTVSSGVCRSIEIPRAALLADEIAEVAEFFSFGTNNLTQMGMGLSRDDAGRFLPEYVDRSRFPAPHCWPTRLRKWRSSFRSEPTT